MKTCVPKNLKLRKSWLLIRVPCEHMRTAATCDNQHIANGSSISNLILALVMNNASTVTAVASSHEDGKNSVGESLRTIFQKPFRAYISKAF